MERLKFESFMPSTNTLNEHALEIICRTDTGLIREHNEDSLDSAPELGLAVLADGMGGYEAGEVASEIAVRQVMERLKRSGTEKLKNRKEAREILARAVTAANLAILDYARRHPEYRGMGTTLVAAARAGATLTLAHVGDSRAYRWRQHRLEQLTRDHSVLQELLENKLCTPEQARFYPNRNLVTRALGVQEDMDVDIRQVMARPGDVYLLCSDGLSDMLEDREIAGLLLHSQANLKEAANQLIGAANRRGGADNISVILLRVPGLGPWFPWRHWWNRLRGRANDEG